MSENKAWECPRCGRMNAPFNPTCFCPAEVEIVENSAQTPPSQHVMDAFNYMMGKPLDEVAKIAEGIKRQTAIAQGMMPNFYNSRCSICNGVHGSGQDCATLKNNIPPNGEFI